MVFQIETIPPYTTSNRISNCLEYFILVIGIIRCFLLNGATSQISVLYFAIRSTNVAKFRVECGILWASEAEDFFDNYFWHDWINWILIVDE